MEIGPEHYVVDILWIKRPRLFSPDDFVRAKIRSPSSRLSSLAELTSTVWKATQRALRMRRPINSVYLIALVVVQHSLVGFPQAESVISRPSQGVNIKRNKFTGLKDRAIRDRHLVLRQTAFIGQLPAGNISRVAPFVIELDPVVQRITVGFNLIDDDVRIERSGRAGLRRICGPSSWLHILTAEIRKLACTIGLPPPRSRVTVAP